MSTRTEFVEYVVEQAGLGERLTFRKMFGEFALYLDGKVMGLACDDSLFIKPTAAAAELAPRLPQRAPYPGARLHPVADELLDHPELLQRLILETAALVPAPRPRSPRKGRRNKEK